jgi:putative restriction endonuclease
VRSEASNFSLFDPNESLVETRIRRLARTIVFRKQLLRLYDGRCAVCRHALQTPSGLSELEGAHIVPRNLGGTNDARNGLGLCRQHHWAFDKGLFGIDGERRIFVADASLNVPQNEPLRPFHGKPLLEACDAHLRAHPNALQWHFENTVIKNC